MTAAAIAKSKELLEKAISLHSAHIEGGEPTSDASQRKLMGYLEGAEDALEGDMESNGGMIMGKGMKATKKKKYGKTNAMEGAKALANRTKGAY